MTLNVIYTFIDGTGCEGDLRGRKRSRLPSQTRSQGRRIVRLIVVEERDCLKRRSALADNGSRCAQSKRSGFLCFVGSAGSHVHWVLPNSGVLAGYILVGILSG
jgi:hypothetical protein